MRLGRSFQIFIFEFNRLPAQFRPLSWLIIVLGILYWSHTHGPFTSVQTHGNWSCMYIIYNPQWRWECVPLFPWGLPCCTAFWCSYKLLQMPISKWSLNTLHCLIVCPFSRWYVQYKFWFLLTGSPPILLGHRKYGSFFIHSKILWTGSLNVTLISPIQMFGSWILVSLLGLCWKPPGCESFA